MSSSSDVSVISNLELTNHVPAFCVTSETHQLEYRSKIEMRMVTRAAGEKIESVALSLRRFVRDKFLPPFFRRSQVQNHPKTFNLRLDFILQITCYLHFTAPPKNLGKISKFFELFSRSV